MAESRFLLVLLVVALGAPVRLGETHLLSARSGGGQRAQEILDELGRSRRPFNEQLLLGTRLAAPIIAMAQRTARPQRARAAPYSCPAATSRGENDSFAAK
jgi:hypothetical protein